MDYSNADSSRPSIVHFYQKLVISAIFLQMTIMTASSIIPLPTHHHLNHHPPQTLQDLPVRWPKSPLNSGQQGRPVDIMTDVINDLGVKILDRYLDNSGNVAFSPSGLGFVLAALYEGSAGTSNSEISDVLNLPRDRRITRIGLRDIHRRLRSYLNADAFLGGLTLNREDINLRPDYEDVLRFYGFDISDSAANDNVTNSTVIPESRNNNDSTIKPETTTGIPDSMVTAGSNDSIDATINVTTAIPSADPSSSTNSVSDDLTTVTIDPGDSTNSTDSIPISMATNLEANSSTEASTTSIAETSITDSTSISTSNDTNSPIGETSTNVNGTLSTIMPRLMGTTTTVTQSQNSMESTVASPTTTTINPTTIPITTISMENRESTTMGNVQNASGNNANDTASNRIRKRRGILHRPTGFFSSFADDGIWLDEFGRFSNHDDYPSQDEDIVDDSRRSTEVAFLINGCDYSRVTAAVYTAFLPFAHFPSLRASMLEFPLDDPRYKILMMLPRDENGTRRLARILTMKPITLRNLRRSLQPTWVTAVVPSFMLRGFVTLTPYLQRLGITDVFDPRAADLTLMSPDLGVYARDIQQSIGVNIRNNAKRGVGSADGGDAEKTDDKRKDDDLVRNVRGLEGPFFVSGGFIAPGSPGNLHYPSYLGPGNPQYERAPPVPFVVDRPFLYFIIDDETSVTLLAGRIDDPLNSRML